MCTHTSHSSLCLFTQAVFFFSLSIFLKRALINLPFLPLLSLSLPLAFSTAAALIMLARNSTVSLESMEINSFLWCECNALSHKWLTRRTNTLAEFIKFPSYRLTTSTTIRREGQRAHLSFRRLCVFLLCPFSFLFLILAY